MVVLGSVCLALAPMAVYDRLGTAVLLIAALAAQPDVSGTLARMRRFSTNARVRLGATLALWATVTLAWTPAPHFIDLLRLLAVPVMGLLLIGAVSALSAVDKGRMARLALTGGLAMLAMLALEVWSQGALFALIIAPDPGPIAPGQTPWIVEVSSRGTAVLAPLAFVYAFLIYTHAPATRYIRAAAALIFIALVFAVCKSSSMDASWVAVMAGMIVFGAALLAPRLALMGVLGGLATYAVLAPVISTYVLTLNGLPDLSDPSWVEVRTRIAIWQEAARLIAERPALGHGFDATRVLAAQASTIPGTQWSSLPLHTHNGFLQIWLELGGVGIALTVALLAQAARALWPMTARPLHLAVTLATLTSTAVIALISFGIWQYWWLATWMLTAAMLYLALRAAPTQVCPTQV